MSLDTQPSLLPFNSAKINDKYLVTNMMGCWDALDEEEFRQLNSLKVLEGGALFDRLLEKGLIMDADNIRRVIDGYRSLNANLFNDTAHHVAIVTKLCNVRCAYPPQDGSIDEEMSRETIRKVRNYILAVRNKKVALEIQGGEPLLHWMGVKYLVEITRHFCSKKNPKIILMTNMLLMNNERMNFLAEHDVQVGAFLDGPAEIHDKNWKDLRGQGTHARVVERVLYFSKKYGRAVSLVPTITRHSLAHPESIIDEYVRLGQKEIYLRPLNKIGHAGDNWDEIGYTAEEFIKFYDRAMAYIMKLNAQGTYISERMARISLTKILNKQDPGWAQMMNPSGAGRAVMSYSPDGSCYPGDEARLSGDNIFLLGNIMNEDYDKIVSNENLLYLLSAGCSDLWNYRSVYSPWLGTDPVISYAEENNVILKGGSRLPLIYKHQFKTVFSYLLGDKKYADVLQRWAQESLSV